MTAQPLKPHYKVRVVFPGSIIHLASWAEPHAARNDLGRFTVSANWIEDPAYGDTAGLIDWPAALAVTWRYNAGSDGKDVL